MTSATNSSASMATLLFILFGVGLIHRGFSDPPVEVSPISITMLPGYSVAMLCKVPYILNYCRIIVPGHQPYVFTKKGDSINGLSYYGRGIENGECGVSINQVEENNNGKVVCLMPPNVGSEEINGTMELIVARPKNPSRL